MKNDGIGILAILLVFVGLFLSCEKEGGNETKISHYNASSSHNTGQNCMNCHKDGGSGEGWFNIAGTVYDELKSNIYPNATVKFYTGANGTGDLVYTSEGDALGNFYSTENINFGTGIYTSVEGDGLTKYMTSPITTGQCNSCHGNIVDKIWTK